MDNDQELASSFIKLKMRTHTTLSEYDIVIDRIRL